jgi:hypothetical protein
MESSRASYQSKRNLYEERAINAIKVLKDAVNRAVGIALL